MERKSSLPGLGVKLIALLLMLGGIFGAIWGLYQEAQILSSIGSSAAAWSGLFVVLFGWSAWVGFELWHGKVRAFKLAKIIFAAQIPIFSVNGFAFDGFFTGLRVYFAISEQPPNLRWGFNLASGIHFIAGPQIDYWLFGVNLLAVVALFHLMRASSDKQPVKDSLD